MSNSRQVRAQRRRDIKRINNLLIPMFKSMIEELQKPDFDKQLMIEGLRECIDDMEEKK